MATGSFNENHQENVFLSGRVVPIVVDVTQWRVRHWGHELRGNTTSAARSDNWLLRSSAYFTVIDAGPRSCIEFSSLLNPSHDRQYLKIVGQSPDDRELKRNVASRTRGRSPS
jgi:hypothetical protein